ncbi:MAG: DNA repair protein RecO [Pseudomonadota bacterium]
MLSKERIKLQPAWILHRRDFRDSSQIVEVFSRDYGRVAMVARGVKRPKSRHRGILQPFSALRLSWVTGRDLGTLTDAEQIGQPLVLTGEALMCGFYINELLMKLTHRFDAIPSVFDGYAETIQSLASDTANAIALREFEWLFLREAGFGIELAIDATSGQPVDEERRYHVIVDEGPVLAEEAADMTTYSGATLKAISVGDWTHPLTLRAARRILGAAIDRQLDGKTLHTRRIIRELRQQSKSNEK